MHQANKNNSNYAAVYNQCTVMQIYDDRVFSSPDPKAQDELL